MGGRSPWRRRAAFVAWNLLAVGLLLECVFQVGACWEREELTDLAVPVDEDALRVLAVGDSWVAGAEAPQGEGFVDHLGRELGATLGGRDVQLFNLGRTGANSAHVALTVLDEGPRLRPDLIVVLVGQNNASNFARVAEVEERLGREAGFRPWEHLRTWKAARILWTNARGGSDYTEAEAPFPEPVRGPDGMPVCADPWLQEGPARAYRDREASRAEGAWAVLQAAARRDVGAAARIAVAIAQARGWDTTSRDPSAPTATERSEAIDRYALLRLARMQGNWRGVRYHGGAFIDSPLESAIVDVGAAEALVLAGDWRRARRRLLAAHLRCPGFPDTIDLATRFPDTTRDGALYEALEFAPAGSLLAWEEAAVRAAVNELDASAQARRDWLEQNPADEDYRQQTARWLRRYQDRDEADRLLYGRVLEEGEAPPEPAVGSYEAWATWLARTADLGEPERALAAARRARQEAPASAAVSAQASRVLAAFGECEEAVATARDWFALDGDASTVSQALEPCQDARQVAATLEPLRAAWGPVGGVEAWTALVRAGHKPFELLFRDLDLVAEQASALGAELLLVNYPNPSEDHSALRAILADYGQSRGVPVLDLWGRFAANHDGEAWAARLGPNGHCNALGYREMADGILEYLRGPAGDTLRGAP